MKLRWSYYRYSYYLTCKVIFKRLRECTFWACEEHSVPYWAAHPALPLSTRGSPSHTVSPGWGPDYSKPVRLGLPCNIKDADSDEGHARELGRGGGKGGRGEGEWVKTDEIEAGNWTLNEEKDWDRPAKAQIFSLYHKGWEEKQSKKKGRGRRNANTTARRTVRARKEGRKKEKKNETEEERGEKERKKERKKERRKEKTKERKEEGKMLVRISKRIYLGSASAIWNIMWLGRTYLIRETQPVWKLAAVHISAVSARLRRTVSVPYSPVAFVLLPRHFVPPRI